MKKKEKSAYIIQTVDSALDVLEQFHDSEEELGLTELCRRLKLHKNKVYRLLATLESRNYIEQNKATTTYRLGMKNLHLGQAFINQMGMLRQARSVLESLTKKCEETSYLAVQKNFRIICLDAIESNLPVRVVPRVGSTLPFYCTAAGKVLVAGMSDKNLREYFKSAGIRKYTSNTISHPDELTSQLRRIVELGYALDDEEMDVGVKCVGAPIRDYTKHVVGAVSISVPSMRFTAERMNDELIPLIKEAAGEISVKLGYN